MMIRGVFILLEKGKCDTIIEEGEEKSEKLQASLSQGPGKVMFFIIWKIIFRHMTEKKVTGNGEQVILNQPNCFLWFNG